MTAFPKICSVPETVFTRAAESTSPIVKLARSKINGLPGFELSMSSTPEADSNATLGVALPPPPQPGTIKSAGAAKSAAPANKRPTGRKEKVMKWDAPARGAGSEQCDIFAVNRVLSENALKCRYAV